MKLKVGKKTFNVKVADTDERRRQGLAGLSKLPIGSGLVLKYNEPTMIPITMAGMKFPLGIVHTFDGAVQAVTKAQPDQEENIIINQYSDAVLEVNVEDVNGIKEGDKLEWIGSKETDGKINFVPGEDDPKEGQLHVLNDKGQVQTNVRGNERVFSRKDTQNIYEKAIRAKKSGEDKHYAALGRTFVNVINRQDTQKQEHVKE